MKTLVESYKDMVGRKITGIAVDVDGITKFFLEDGGILIMNGMEIDEDEN
jgi:hypothetical protein